MDGAIYHGERVVVSAVPVIVLYVLCSCTTNCGTGAGVAHWPMVAGETCCLPPC